MSTKNNTVFMVMAGLGGLMLFAAVVLIFIFGDKLPEFIYRL